MTNKSATHTNTHASRPLNDMAIVGLVVAFVCAPAGFVLSLIGLKQTKKRNEAGKELAIAGIVMSVLMFFLQLLLIALIVFLTIISLQIQVSERRARENINIIHAQLEAFYDQEREYPTLDELNDSQWRAQYMPVVTDDVLSIKAGTGHKLVSVPKDNRIVYDVRAANDRLCDNVLYTCKQYELSTRVDDGYKYSKRSLGTSRERSGQ